MTWVSLLSKYNLPLANQTQLFFAGYSSASLTVSPAGYALFSGYLDKTLPKDGKVVRAGYAYMGSLKSRQPFFLPETHHEFYQFTHVVLRVRGDGRRYFIAFDTSDRLDITWFDRYQYMLYTHGGPYWQYVKVCICPLSLTYTLTLNFLLDSPISVLFPLPRLPTRLTSPS